MAVECLPYGYPKKSPAAPWSRRKLRSDENLGNFNVGHRVSFLFVRKIRRIFAGLKDDLVDPRSIYSVHAGLGIGEVKSGC
jgi:hypothetical protein